MLELRTVFDHTCDHLGTLLCSTNCSCTVHAPISLVQECPQTNVVYTRGNFIHASAISLNQRTGIFSHCPWY